MDTATFIQNMPKAELHVHLEGTLEPRMARRLAERNKMPVPEGVPGLKIDTSLVSEEGNAMDTSTGDGLEFATQVEQPASEPVVSKGKGPSHKYHDSGVDMSFDRNFDDSGIEMGLEDSNNNASAAQPVEAPAPTNQATEVTTPGNTTAIQPTSSDAYAITTPSSLHSTLASAMTVLQTSDDFFELTFAYLLKCKKQNVLLTEMFLSPQAHTGRGVTFSTVITGIRRGMSKARRELGVSASLIMNFDRSGSAGWAMATLMEALAYKRWIIGVGLDGEEEGKGSGPAKFEGVFKRATQEGFMVTCHCGVGVEGSLENIRQAVEVVDVDRIDHGVDVLGDEALLGEIKEKGIGLTTCPLSNEITAGGLKGWEIKKLLDRGVRVTVNSDMPAFMKGSQETARPWNQAGYMNENMMKMHEETGLNLEDLLQLQINAFTISWTSNTVLRQYLGMLEDYRWQTLW